MLENNKFHNTDRLIKMAVWLRLLGQTAFLLWLLLWALFIFQLKNTFTGTTDPYFTLGFLPLNIGLDLFKSLLEFLALAGSFLAALALSEIIYLLLDIEFNTRGKVNDD